MKKVLILGAGMVSKPMFDYFHDKCKYQVVVAARNYLKATKMVKDKVNVKAYQWDIDNLDLLDKLVEDADLAVSMIPPTMHIPVAKACLKHKTNMVTTSYLNPEMLALDEAAKEQGIIILNEIGEDPGIDHMGAKRMIDEIHKKFGQVISLNSYGAGLPSFEHNRNPMGYKFSWSPKGVLMAARTPAAYLKDGRRVDVAAEDLFDHHWLVDIGELGTFETYPNRDSTKYREYFGLDENVSLFRGLLRFIGWCNTLGYFRELNLLDDSKKQVWTGKTYRDFSATIIGKTETVDLAKDFAEILGVKENENIIKRLRWLGLFDDKILPLDEGSNADVLVGLMVEKMTYGANEKDMIIVHDEIVAKFKDGTEKWTSTMMVEGIPGGDSAMSRAVSLPAAIAGKLILEKEIYDKGVHIPVLPSIYNPVLDELEEFGYKFKHETVKMQG